MDEKNLHLAHVSPGENDRGIKIHALKKVTADEYKQIRADKKTISNYIESSKLARSVQLNQEDFLKFIVDCAADFLASNGIDEEKFEGVDLNLSRLFMNTLGMFRSFLDHTDTTLSHEYGKKSEELKSWKEITAREYDSVFEYRFLYNLRNYVQHLGPPPFHISFSDGKDIEGVSIRLDFMNCSRKDLYGSRE